MKLLTAALITAVYLISFSSYHKWTEFVVGGGDSWGYYAYLPALFIQQDLKTLDQTIAVRKQLKPGSVQTRDGKLFVGEAPAFGDANIIKYTCGLAVLNALPFFAAHAYTLLTDREQAHGFSTPYIFALFLASLLCIFIGFWLIWKLIRPNFGLHPALATVLCIALATNLYYFGVINNVMSHPYLFTLWALLLWSTDQFYRSPTLRSAIFIGLSVGLITLVRPSEGICALVPALWGLTSVSALRKRLGLIGRYWPYFLLMVILGFLCLLPQLAYWKYTTGDWIYYSYGNEGFDFTNPKIWRGLFGFMNGWLPYTPVMVLALIGILFWRGQEKGSLPVLLTVLPLHIYIIYSWWNWYYINGFGSRPMIEMYPLLAIPMAAFFNKIHGHWRGVVGIFCMLCIGLNLFQTWQMNNGTLRTSLGSAAYYWQAFGATHMNQRISSALDLKNYQPDNLEPSEFFFKEGFEDINVPSRDSAIVKNGKFSYLITPAVTSELQKWTFPSDEIPLKSKQRLAISCWIYVNKQISNYYGYTSFEIDHVRNGKIYKRQFLRLNNKPGNPHEISIWWGKPKTWYQLQAFLRISPQFKPGDQLSFKLISPHAGSAVFIDDIEIAFTRRRE